VCVASSTHKFGATFCAVIDETARDLVTSRIQRSTRAACLTSRLIEDQKRVEDSSFTAVDESVNENRHPVTPKRSRANSNAIALGQKLSAGCPAL
jgi:hypothetical protein